MLDAQDWGAIWLTLKLATIVTVLLLLLGTPVAWWLAQTRSRMKGVVGALVRHTVRGRADGRADGGAARRRGRSLCFADGDIRDGNF